MSGRALHLRDGELITNRKTDRRQSPKRPLLDRLDDLNERTARRFPSKWTARMGFALPKSWRPFVSDGTHGTTVRVFKGFVQIYGGSAPECFQSAIEFCAVIGRGRDPEIFMAVLRSASHPDRRYGRWCSVVNGALVECSGWQEPRVYLARGNEC